METWRAFAKLCGAELVNASYEKNVGRQMLLLWVKKNFAGIYLKKEFCRNARDICTAVEIYSRCIKYGTWSLHRQAGTYLNVVIHSPPLRSSSIWSIQCECRRVQYLQVQCFPETGTGMPALVLLNSCPFMQKLTCEIWAWKELWWSEFWTETFAFRLIFSSEEKWLFGSATVDKRVGSACFQNQTYLYFFETIELHRY